MHETRGARVDWYWLMLIAVILLALLVAFWPGAPSQGGSASPTVPSMGGMGPTRPEPDSSSTARTVFQPDSFGYDYRVSTEHYVVRQQNGQLEVQDRRRESWSAADGWAWARQTGSDPARFIFRPTTEWKAITANRPTTAAQQQVLREAAGTAKTADEVTQAEFAFVQDLLSVENMPESALPKNYRSTLISALATHDRVASTRHVDDPAGRDSTRVSWTTSALRLSLYLDRDGNFLACTEVAEDTGERGSRVITNQRRTSEIPWDLLTQLGSQRVEKAFWS